ncbi:MAG: hypothetical protein EZS28_035485, partial [Streblomastix strix]
ATGGNSRGSVLELTEMDQSLLCDTEKGSGKMEKDNRLFSIEQASPIHTFHNGRYSKSLTTTATQGLHVFPNKAVLNIMKLWFRSNPPVGFDTQPSNTTSLSAVPGMAGCPPTGQTHPQCPQKQHYDSSRPLIFTAVG